MENVLNKLAEVKEGLIQYIIECADKNQLSYLFTDYDKENDVILYHFEFDKKFFITEDVIYRLNSFSIEALADYCKRIQNDLNKVLHYNTLHDYQLVNQINECYIKDNKRFLEIVQLIAQREKVRVKKLISFNLELDDIETIHFFVTDILTHICDDKDLECIISYCRK